MPSTVSSSREGLGGSPFVYRAGQDFFWGTGQGGVSKSKIVRGGAGLGGAK